MERVDSCRERPTRKRSSVLTLGVLTSRLADDPNQLLHMGANKSHDASLPLTLGSLTVD